MPVQKAVGEVVADLLWHCDAIQVRPNDPFRLSSGNFTPLYVNCRVLLSHPAVADVVTSLFHLRCSEIALDPGSVAGGETGGIAFGAWLAHHLNKPFVYVRRKAKGYGTVSRVEGLPQGEVLLVEDMVTDGGTKIGFIEAIREIDHEIRHCMVVLDRLQGATGLLKTKGVTLHSLTDIRTCLDVGALSGVCDPETIRVVLGYLENPAEWHAQRGLTYLDVVSAAS